MFNKKSALFFISQFFSRLADHILLFLVPLVVYKITESASISGFSFFLETLPRFIWFPIAGILSGYISPYKLLNISQLMRFIIVILGLIGYCFYESFYWLITISAIVGVLTTQGDISREVIIPQIFKKYPLQKIFSYTQLAEQLGMVLAPLLAILLLSFISWDVIVALTAVLFLIADISLKLWWARTRFIFKVKSLKSMKIIDDLKIGLRNIVSIPKLLSLIVLAFSINLILGALLASVIPIFTGLLGESQSAYASLHVMGIVATMVVLLVTAKFTFKLKIMGILSFLVMTAGAFLTGISDNSVLYVIGYVLIVGFDKMFNIYSRTFRAKIIAEKDFGKTIGLIVLFNNISQPIAGLIIAVYANIIGVQSIVLYISIFAFLLGVIVFILQKIKSSRFSIVKS